MIVDVVYGFLGAGKTTFITRVLKEWGDREKIVVLVNEFGEVGIDGTLLQGLGGDIIEMPSGCICCTLQADFRSQILEITRTIHPQRVIIEPTGVATIAQIRSILKAQLFDDLIDNIHHVLIADATGFMGLYKSNPRFVESQVENAHVVLLNKCDKVERRRAILTRDAISAINPDATVLMTEHGAVDWAEYNLALSAPHGLSVGDEARTPISRAQGLDTEHGGRLFQMFEERDALGYASVGFIYKEASFDRDALENLFQQLSSPQWGEIVRAKGIFQVADRWILMELASGELSTQVVRQAEGSRVSIIGRNLMRDRIAEAFDQCIAQG